MPVTPQQATENWLNGLRNATARIRQGVENVREAPTAAAARAVDRYLAGVQTAVADGSYVNGLMSVSREDWIRSFLDRGLARVASGAATSAPDMTNFYSEFLPYVESGAAQVRQMPRGDVESGIARAAAMIRHNAQFRRNRRGQR